MIFLEVQQQTVARKSRYVPSYCSVTDPLGGAHIREAQKLPTTLALVSRRWRDTAQTIPQLRRFVHAELTSELTSDQVSATTQRLARIGMRYNGVVVPTLRFHVYVKLGADVARDSRFEGFFYQLYFICQHSRAFELVASDGFEDFYDSYLSKWFGGGMEYLESLCLVARSSIPPSPRLLPTVAEYPRTDYTKLFPTCPRLRSIQLGNFPIAHYASSSFARDATNIKHIELWWGGEATGLDIITMLQLCPSTPAMTFNVHSALESDSGPVLCHTALRCLKLTLWNDFDVDFATGWTLPNLERIIFDGTETTFLRGFGGAIASFLDRVCPNVSSVFIDQYDVESSITRTLRALPRLKSLKICVSTVHDDALFAPNAQHTLPPFPALEELIIDSASCATGFTGRPLMEFIRTRFRKSTDPQSRTLSSAPHAGVPHLKRVFVSLEEDQFSGSTNDDLIESWDAEYLEIIGDQDMRPGYSPTDDVDQLEQEFMVYEYWTDSTI